MTKYDLNLRDYWRIIKKRKFIIIFTFLAMVLFSFTSAILTSPTPLYKANTTIKFEKSVPITGLYDQTVMSTGNLETEAAVIKSYYMQELVAKRLNLIPKDASSEMVRNNPQYIRIILDLRDKIQTEQDGVSNLININVTSTDPKLAQTLANTIAQVYKDEHAIILNKRSTDARKFIESQLVISRDKLARSEEAVKEFREKNKFVTAEGEAAGLSTQLAGLQAANDREMSTYQQVVQMSRFLRGAEDRNLSSDKAFTFSGATSSYSALNDKLVQLMLQREMLLLAYTENFPQVQELKKQIQEVLKAMKNQLAIQERTLAVSVGLLKRQIGEVEEKLRSMPEKGLELTRLDRNVGVDKEIYTLLEKKYQEALIQEAVKIEEVQIVKPALEPTFPINKAKVGVNTTLGMIIGLILGVVFAFLIETFDTSIGAIEEIEEFLKTRVLGIIPYLKIDEVKTALKDQLSEDVDNVILKRQIRLISHFMPNSTLAENYRSLRTNFNFLIMEKDVKSVVITSTYPEEGKTSVTCNLAITLAQTGRKVLLVDGDFRRPVISRVFGIDSVPGFTDVILGNFERRKVIRSITDLMMGDMSVEDITKTPGLDNLYLLTSGTAAPNPAELIGSKGVAEMIKMFRTEYDVVLIDAPPVLAATDATIWSGMADGVILVYQVGRAARGALKRARAQLDNVKANVLGIVLNGLKADISPDFTYQDRYDYYYGGYGSKKRKKYISFAAKLSSLFQGNVLADAKKAVKEKLDKIKEEKKQPSETLPIESADSGRKKSLLKIIVLIAALVFLGLGALYQTGYLNLSMVEKEEIIPQKQGITEKKSISSVQAKAESPDATISQSQAPQIVPPVQTGVPPVQQSAPSVQQSMTPIQQSAVPVQPSASQTPKVTPEAGKMVPNKDHYAIQIVSLFDASASDQIVSDLKGKGMAAYLEKIDIRGKGTINKIYIGPFKDKKAAEAFLKKNRQIEKAYPDNILVRREFSKAKQ